jgi:hypothetical protein
MLLRLFFNLLFFFGGGGGSDWKDLEFGLCRNIQNSRNKNIRTTKLPGVAPATLKCNLLFSYTPAITFELQSMLFKNALNFKQYTM